MSGRARAPGRVRRLLRRLGVGSVVLLLALCAAVWTLLGTQPGLRLAWRFVEPRMPETVTVGSVGGSLLGPLHAEEIVFATEAVTVSVARADVDWDLRSLLRRGLDIRELAVRGVRIVVDTVAAPAEPDTAVLSLPDVHLPVEVRLERGHVRDIEVLGLGLPVEGTDGRTGPVGIDSLSLGGVTFRTELTLSSLRLDAPEGWVTASGGFRPSDRYPFDVAVEASIDLPDPNPPVSARAEVSGDLDLISVDAVVTRPLEALLAGTVADPLGRPLLDARVTVEQTPFASVVGDAPDGSASGEFEVQGFVDSLRVQGNARVTTPTTGAVDLDLDVERRADLIRIDRLLARLGPTRVEAHGTVILDSESPRLDVRLRWAEARWPLDGEPQVRSAAGTGSIVGTTASYRVRAEGDVDPLGRPGGQVAMEGSGSPADLNLSFFHLEALDGSVDATGRVSWEPVLRWDLRFTARDLLVGPLLTDSTLHDTRVTMGGGSSGTYEPARLVTDVALDTVTGVARGEPFDGSVVAWARVPFRASRPDLEAAHLRLERFSVTAGPARVEGAGSVTDTIAFELTADLPDLTLLAPSVSGAALAHVRATGPRRTPSVDLSVDAWRLLLEDEEARGPVGTSPDPDEAGDLRSAEALEVEEDTGTPSTIDSLTFRVTGTPGVHEASARLVRGETTLDAAMSGGYADSVWTGDLERLDLLVPRFGLWSLVAAASATASRGQASLGEACLASDPARMCLEGTWIAEGPMSGSVALTGLTGQRLLELMPSGWSTTGGLEGRARASVASDGTLDAEGTVNLGSGSLDYPGARGPRRLSYSDAVARATVDETGAHLTFGTSMRDEEDVEVITVAGEIALPELRNVRDSIPPQPLEGFVRAHLEEFGPIRAVLPEVGEIGGDAEVDLTLAGTVARAQVLGEAWLREGSVDLPGLGLQLRDIDVTARGGGTEGIELQGSVRSGTGVLTIDGAAPVAPTPDNPARIEVTGTRFQAVALPEVTVWISPALQVTASPEGAELTGSITVPVARVELTEVPTTAVRASRDVVFVDDTTALAVAPGRVLRYTVRLVLGDSVTFRGFGLSARPQGGILVTQGAGDATIGTGEITLVDGRYQAYGQDLVMERGRILFAGGPVDNPALDIRASRTASDGTIAGLEVRGPLDNPSVTLFSDPDMVEGDILAYIMLGRPFESASGSEGDRVTAAATALGMQRGNQIVGRLGQSLGIQDMRVEAEGSIEEAALVAGTYLSPQLYVSYGVGLFEPISTFRLRYMLSRRWTLRAETGKANSADLLFRFERGR